MILTFTRGTFQSIEVSAQRKDRYWRDVRLHSTRDIVPIQSEYKRSERASRTTTGATSAGLRATRSREFVYVSVIVKATNTSGGPERWANQDEITESAGVEPEELVSKYKAHVSVEMKV